MKVLLDQVAAVARRAGEAILEVYHRAGDLEVTEKEDDSPLTQADLAAHAVIVRGLAEIAPSIPLLSEESDPIPEWPERQAWHSYWLVDPLDGTKEFIKGNGEFTVNIALVEKGEPVLGAVYVPARDMLYRGARGVGAFRSEAGKAGELIRTAPMSREGPLRVVASRRHGGERLKHLLGHLETSFPRMEFLSMGSSLKICLVAEGRADLYPRLAPTSEWDTAAAQAVLEAAGGVLTAMNLSPYRYNQKRDLLNPHFYAMGDPDYPWSKVLPEADFER